MKNNLLFFFTLLVFQFALGQSVDEKIIFCNIVADYNANQNVNIINVRTEKATISDKEGAFKIIVKVGDVLVLSSVSLETKRKTISQEDLDSDKLIIKMSTRINTLIEVNVNENAAVNAESLGIIPHGQKKYSPAERKLATASSGRLNPLGLDPLLNKISGRTAMLKKEIVVERNEKLLVKLDGFYEDEYYTEVLKIPEEYIKGFQYYLIEDADFVRALKDKNKTMAQFLVKKLAANYNKIIQEEEK